MDLWYRVATDPIAAVDEAPDTTWGVIRCVIGGGRGGHSCVLLLRSICTDSPVKPLLAPVVDEDKVQSLLSCLARRLLSLCIEALVRSSAHAPHGPFSTLPTKRTSDLQSLRPESHFRGQRLQQCSYKYQNLIHSNPCM